MNVYHFQLMVREEGELKFRLIKIKESNVEYAFDRLRHTIENKKWVEGDYAIIGLFYDEK